MDIIIFDKQGNRIDLETYGRLHEDMNYRVIGSTKVGEKVVSTVWLGFDHAHVGSPPLIFETMIFPGNENFDNEYCDRYSTEEEAVAGHQQAVESLRFIIEEEPTLI